MKEIISLRNKREKHFENGDGTVTAYMYNDDVHYLKEGEYKEIDNTLIENVNHYENKENEFKVIFNKESSDLLDIHKEGHYLKLYINNENLTLNKKDETIKYTNENLEIDYKIIGSKVKESIILKNKNSISNSLEFTIDTNLELFLLENGTIEAKCNDDLVFIIDKSFMIDKKEEVNTNLNYKLTKENNYKLTLILDKDWLLSEKREYPVIIDPTIINSGRDDNLNVYNTYVCSAFPDLTHSHKDTLFTGVLENDTYTDIRRTLLKFILPNIGTGFNIINAKLMLTHTDVIYAIGSTHPRIEIHEINTDWNEETATWETMNNKYNERIEALFRPEVYHYGEDPRIDNVDITDLVKSWYSGSPNHGIMLKATNEVKEESVYAYRIWSKTYDELNETAKRPFLIITYIRQNGIRNEMTYTDLNFSNGKTCINNYTGNVTSMFSLNKTISNKYPISLDIVYNTEDILYSSDLEIAKGWKLGFSESLEPKTIDVTEYLLYKDKTNADHYFYKVEDNKYKDEDGLNLTINVTNDVYEMVDSTGNKKIFNKVGEKILLTKIVDVQNNEVNIIYSSGKITKVTDGNNEEINITYNNNLITISSYYDTAKINISNNLITSLETKNGTVEFSYDSNNLISKIKDIDNMSVCYEYYNVSPFKLYKATNYGLNNTVGRSIKFDYSSNATSIIDDEERKTVYIFDSSGHTINTAMYTKGKEKHEDAYVNEDVYYYYPEVDIPGFEKYENKKNKLLFSNPSTKYVNNLLLNSGFEKDLNECNFTINNCQRLNYRPNSGDYALKVMRDGNLTFNITEGK